MSRKPGRLIHGIVLALVAATTLTLGACSTVTVEPDGRVPVEEGLAALRIDLERLAARLDEANRAHTRSIDGLIQQLAVLTEHESALRTSVQALRTDLTEYQTRADGRHELVRELLRSLENATTKQIEGLHAEIDRLNARLARLEGEGPGPAGDGPSEARMAVALESIATSLSTKTPFPAQLLPSLIGTLIGAALALVSGLLLGRLTRKHADEQKRLDVTIKLTDTFMSPTMLTTYGEAKGIVSNAGSHTATPEELNKVVAVVGFFNYVCALKKMGRLDADLLGTSKMLDSAEKFFKDIHNIPAQCHAQWQPILNAAQPCE